MARGCAGVLLQPTPGLVGDGAVAAYFNAAAAALGPDTPICVQDFPKANGVHISLDVWRMIVEASPGVVMLKAEEEPGLVKLSASPGRRSGWSAGGHHPHRKQRHPATRGVSPRSGRGDDRLRFS